MLPTLFRFVLLAVLLWTSFSRPGLADTFPLGFTSETVVSGLSLPTSIAFAAGNRMFISTRSGIVRLVVNGALQPQPFVDISAETAARSDRGLLGIAVHPNFPAEPYVYLLHAHDPPGVTPDTLGSRVARLLRVTADSAQGFNVALTAPASRQVLLGKNSNLANVGDPLSTENLNLVACQSGPAGAATAYVEDCIPSDADTHSVGTVRFGADGRLYVGMGDASSSNVTDARALRAQELDSMAGKVFRIDAATGQGLPDNPFYNGNPNANRSKVWNYGMRNPFKFTQHPVTQAWYFGDVGWNDWEEINTGNGRNFGWPCYEGDAAGSAQQSSYAVNPATSGRCQQLYSQGAGAVQGPLIAYPHNGAGAAVILGNFYSGTSYPETFRNALFYADYNTGDVRAAKLDASGNVTADTLFGNITATTGLFSGPDSDLYYISYGDGTGAIRRLRFNGGGAPVARISATPVSGIAPLTVNFNGGASTDPENQPLTYTWDFGVGGAASTAVNPSFTYASGGSYTARLTVTDTTGQTSTAQIVIAVGTPPVVTINTPAVGATYASGDTIAFSGAASDVQDGSLSNSIRWTVTLNHNDHQHIDIVTLPAAAASGSFVVPDHGQNTFITLCASVTDSSGLAAQSCRELRPRTVAYTFNTSPQGLQVVYDGVSRTAPFLANAIVNSQVDVSVPTPQQTCQLFTAWSDGNTNATRRLLIGTAAATLSANFNGSQCGGGSDLLGHWKFDEGSGGFAADASGNGNTAALLSTGWIAGRAGFAANLYGEANSHVRVPASASLNSVVNQITISAFAYRHFEVPGLSVVASRQSGSGAGHQWVLGFNGGRPTFGVLTTGGEQAILAAASSPLQQWIHLVGVYDGAAMRLYVNGVEAASAGKTGNLVVDTGKALLIGGKQIDTAFNSAALLFDGRADEVRVYRRALNVTEVRALYDAVTPPSTNQPPTVSLTAPSANASFTAPATISLAANAADSDGSVTRVEFFQGSTKLGEDLTAPYQFTWSGAAAGSYALTARATDNAGAVTTSPTVNVTVNGAPTGGLVGRWRFNEGGGTIAADISGFNNTGRLVNAGWGEGRAGAAVNLFGFNRSHVRVANAPSLNRFTNAMTVAAWVRRDASQSGAIGIITRQIGNGSDNSFFLGLNNNRYSFRVRTPAGEREVIAGTAPTFAWLHMVATYDGGILRLYVNGVQVATASQSGNVASDGKPIVIGGNQNDTAADNAELLLNGRIDDARIYDRVLTAAEIRAIYDLGAQ